MENKLTIFLGFKPFCIYLSTPFAPNLVTVKFSSIIFNKIKKIINRNDSPTLTYLEKTCKRRKFYICDPPPNSPSNKSGDKEAQLFLFYFTVLF